MTTSTPESVEVFKDVSEGVQNVSNFRRVLPQFLASLAKNLLLINLGQFFNFVAIVIPSLTGLSNALNPDETLHISAVQSSWLSTLAHVAHPIGGVVSGPINDKIGRRKAIMLVNIPLTMSWIILGFSHSFPLICLLFTLVGFCFGLMEAPTLTYVSEISEPSVRSTLASMTVFAYTFGFFIVMGLGAVFSWRQVSLICAVVPVCCLIAVLFVAESPRWLLSKDRPKDAQKSLQWLRGWVSPQTVYQEFTELQNYNNTSNACAECSKKSIRCYHSKPKFWDKIKELKHPRNYRPFILMMGFCFLTNFALPNVLDPFIIQVLIALGIPIDPNVTMVFISVTTIIASFFLITTVKHLGRRNIFFTSLFIVSFCSIALGVYGFVFFPLGWISFQKDPNDTPMDPEHIRKMVGNNGYLALILILIMKFFGRIGLNGILNLYIGEIFPYKLRSFLCGISISMGYVFLSVAAKTYYNIEMLLSLPGATIFYGVLSLIGFFAMYAIMPETEQRSLEDIELHYSDATKSFTDIHIAKRPKATENK